MSAIKNATKKRDLVRKPSLLSKLKPGQRLRLADAPKIEISQSLPKRITAEELDAELRQLVPAGAPAVDSPGMWQELRG